MSAIATPASLGEVERVKTRVRVFTGAVVIDGEYAHVPGVQLSDSLRNASTSERYLLLHNVTMRALDGGQVHQAVSRAPFVLVNTAHASVVVPLDLE
jgi:hypothetical protein